MGTEITRWAWRDPLTGGEEAWGYSLEDALEGAYEDIAPEERPAYVWVGDLMVPVVGGRCLPSG